MNTISPKYIRCAELDEGQELEVGLSYELIGKARDGMLLIRDRGGRLGKFQPSCFAKPSSGQFPRRKNKRIPPVPARPCIVVFDGEVRMTYNRTEKVLEMDGDQYYTVFSSRREAHKAIWHTVHSLECDNPKELASRYSIEAV